MEQYSVYNARPYFTVCLNINDTNKCNDTQI